MKDKHLVLTEMGGGLPEKIKMESFVAFSRSELAKTGGARFVVFFDEAGSPEAQLAVWVKEAEHHKMDYIPLRDPEDREVLHGISIFARPKVRNLEEQAPPVLRTVAKRPLKRSAPKAVSKIEQLNDLKAKLREKHPPKSRWAFGAKIGAIAASFLIMGFLGTALVAVYMYPEQYSACWEVGRTVYLPYLQQCIGWELNG
jgi:hypothetical protein